VKIFNQTRKTILADNAIIAGSFLKRVKGLLGRRVFNYGQAIVLRPCNSVHTFFMRFPIDILFINRDNIVVKAISGFAPFRFSPICLTSRFVIELPAGRIESTLTSQGDQLILE